MLMGIDMAKGKDRTAVTMLADLNRPDRVTVLYCQDCHRITDVKVRDGYAPDTWPCPKCGGVNTWWNWTKVENWSNGNIVVVDERPA